MVAKIFFGGKRGEISEIFSPFIYNPGVVVHLSVLGCKQRNYNTVT